MRSLLSLVLLALPLVFAVHAPAVNHRELAKRAKGDLALRATGARWTFYEAGLGACGQHNSDSDFIVALNQQTFGFSYPSPYCNKKISMTYNGKTTTATIVDSCPGCPVNGLDLTPGLFSFFADRSEGVIYGDWSFEDGSSSGGGGDGGDNDHTTTKKTTTHHTTSTTEHTTTTHTTPTTTYTPPTTTSTTKSSTVSTHSSSAASASARPSSSSHPVPSAPSNSPAEPSGTGSSTSPDSPQNLYGFAQAVIDLTTIVAVSNEGNTD
ncbi:RlpA-like double-psi beta-barrel-protein domain-containing protein-containing protein [Mycena pura]|uniref:RlpA-like double-psi beta-barrel-protein domain-containing protein-containing protein n=1 Tax=Mycena pura TaxID=153505 RepID=A0AAD6VP96_9AGAR|nr:RlpA-like double-psi beta-barrel-protein domain-containing protein-containing protein [Mycena pura]